MSNWGLWVFWGVVGLAAVYVVVVIVRAAIQGAQWEAQWL